MINLRGKITPLSKMPLYIEKIISKGAFNCYKEYINPYPDYVNIAYFSTIHCSEGDCILLILTKDKSPVFVTEQEVIVFKKYVFKYDYDIAFQSRDHIGMFKSYLVSPSIDGLVLSDPYTNIKFWF